VPTAPLAPSANLPLKVDTSAKPETISGLETYPLDDERMAGIGKRMGSCRATSSHSHPKTLRSAVRRLFADGGCESFQPK
jgi:hypothetical protein